MKANLQTREKNTRKEMINIKIDQLTLLMDKIDVSLSELKEYKADKTQMVQMEPIDQSEE
jgi:hypothetical protein